MALNATTAPVGAGKQFPNMEAGTYPTRIVIVADLGLQAQRPFPGSDQKEPRREVLLTYEFTDEFQKDDDGEDIADKPRWLTETFPLYNLGADRAKSTKRYNALDAQHHFEGDYFQFINMPCNVTVVLNPGKGKNVGKVYENVAEVTAMRSKDADKTAELANTPITFDLDDPDLDMFLALPKWIKEKITNNLEFAGSSLSAMLGDEVSPPNNDLVLDEVDDDEVPF
tara:strand:- start:6095 stop:6772 length:678 start_codon:yes stop_codon:yes gene_type:complete